MSLPSQYRMSLSDMNQTIRFTNGNAGIGTTSPSYKLDVSGDINYTGNLYQNGTLFSGGGGSQWTTSSSNIFYSAGNVGIGTTSPVSRLHLGANNTSNNIVFEAGSTADGFNVGWSAINFNGYFSGGENRINTNKNRWRMIVDQRTTDDQMFFETFNGTTTTSLMTFTSTGNIGIGTVTPTSRLYISDTTSNPFSLILDGTSKTTNNGMTINAATGYIPFINFLVNGLGPNIAATATQLQITQSASHTTSINPNGGNVGIGTSSPGYTLDVTGTGRFANNTSSGTNGSLLLTGTDVFGHTLCVGSVAAHKRISFNHNGSVGNIFSYDYSTGPQSLALQGPGGNVGIGTTDPSYRLDVNGDVRGTSLIVAGSGTYTRGSLYSDANWGMIVRSATANPTLAHFSVADSADNKLLHISATNGNVGIGTVAPTFKLDVSGTIRGSSTSASYPFNFITSNSSGQSNVLWMGSSSTSSITQFAFGTAQTTYNAGEIQFNSSYGAGSSSNFLGLGVWGNASQLIVNGSGNIGIGTTAPSQRLHINGNIQMESGGIIGIVPVDAFVYAGRTIGNYAITWAVTDNGANTTHVSGWAGMNFFTSSTSRMVINSSGYIGIGTTAPGNILQVGGAGRLRISNDATDYTLIGTENVDGGTNTRIVISGNTRSGAGGNIDYLATNTGSHNWYTTNSTTFRMILTSAGNLGIGTATPTALLNVNGSAIIENGLLTVRNNGGYGNIELKGDTGSFIDFGPDSIDFRTRIMHIESNRSLQFQVNGGTVAMTLTSAGNIDCGNSLTATNLSAAYIYPTHLARQFDNRAIAPSNTPAGFVGFGFGSYNNNNTAPFSDVLAFNTYIDISGGPQNALMLKKDGIAMRVYQQTYQSASAYSSYKEVVMAEANGTTTITGSGSTLFQLNTGGKLSVLDDVIAFASFSDERLKTNISDLSNDISMEIVNSLRPVSFRWRDTISNVGRRGTDDVGFIAQEVEAVTPYAVDEFTDLGDNNEYKRIKYERLLPYLVGSIQKLTAQLKEYKDELDSLKSKLA